MEEQLPIPQPNHRHPRGERQLQTEHAVADANLPHQPLPVLRERYDRGSGPSALGIGDHDRITTLHHCHHRVGSAQVDADRPQAEDIDQRARDIPRYVKMMETGQLGSDMPFFASTRRLPTAARC